MNPKDRTKFIVDLIKLVLPKLRSIEQISSPAENTSSIDFKNFLISQNLKVISSY